MSYVGISILTESRNLGNERLPLKGVLHGQHPKSCFNNSGIKDSGLPQILALGFDTLTPSMESKTKIVFNLKSSSALFFLLFQKQKELQQSDTEWVIMPK